MKVLIIIPAYNEEKNIESTVKEIINLNNPDIDYIVINDGSTDKTLQVLTDNDYNFINLPTNLGIGGAMLSGYKYALRNNYDIAIQFDGDGQHIAKYIKDLINEIKNGNCNIAIGSRFVNKKKPKSIRMLGSRLISIAIKIVSGKTIKDPTSGMRAFDKSTIECFVDNPNLKPEPNTLVYMIKKGMTIKEIQVEMKERKYGKSYLTPIRSIQYMINMFFSILFVKSFAKKN